MGQVRGARNVTETVQKAIINGHNSGMKHHQISVQFRVPQSAASQVFEERLSQKRFGFSTSTGTSQMDQPNCRQGHYYREMKKKLQTVFYRHFQRFGPGISLYSGSMDYIWGAMRKVLRWITGTQLKTRKLVKRIGLPGWCIAKEHLTWTGDQWNRVISSDESTFSLCGSGGIHYMRRPKRTWYKSSARGVGRLYRIQSTETKEPPLSRNFRKG